MRSGRALLNTLQRPQQESIAIAQFWYKGEPHFYNFVEKKALMEHFLEGNDLSFGT